MQTKTGPSRRWVRGGWFCLLALACTACGESPGAGEPDALSEPTPADGGQRGDPGQVSEDPAEREDSTDATTADIPVAPLTPPVEPSCAYPAASGRIALGETWPEMWWVAAYLADGTSDAFYLSDQHCLHGDATRFGQATTLVMSIGAGWCPACPDYVRYIDSIADFLHSNGALIVYHEVESAGFESVDSLAANHFVNEAGAGSGVRVGDADNRPTPDIIAAHVATYPGAFVVRVDDMAIIADQSQDNAYLDLYSITADPWADWRAGALDPNCSPADEEIYEPNDAALNAATITEGSFSGGICSADNADFYYVDVEGLWEIVIQFDNEIGDLDMYAWDVQDNQPVEMYSLFDSAASKLGGGGTDGCLCSASNENDERFKHEGPGVVMVHGYNRATAAYSLTVSRL